MSNNAFCKVDVLRRAQIDVTVASVEVNNVYATCSRGVKICADTKLEESDFKAVSTNFKKKIDMKKD